MAIVNVQEQSGLRAGNHPIMKTSYLIVGLATLLMASASTPAAEIYVATSGKDGAPGTKDAPLAGLAEAADRAQPGDTIRVAAGTYKFSQPLRLTRSGAEGRMIRVEPADATRPLIDFSAERFGQRGIELRGDWWHILGLEVIGAGNTG